MQTAKIELLLHDAQRAKNRQFMQTAKIELLLHDARRAKTGSSCRWPKSSYFCMTPTI